MKKIIFAISFLMLIGAILGYFAFKDNKNLDQEVFIETTDSIRNLVLLDNELNELLLKSRYGIEKDYDKLIDISRKISEEFDNLRFSAAFEEIEQISNLDQAVYAFDELLIEKLDFVEVFKEQNTLLNKESNRFPKFSQKLINVFTVLNQNQGDIKALSTVHVANTDIANFLLNGSIENKLLVNSRLSEISALRSKLELPAELDDYINNIKTLVSTHESTQKALVSAISEPSSAVLKDVETAYINFYDSAVAKSNNLRNALTIYGVILLLSLIFLGFMLRKSFQGLEKKVAERTEEIEAAYSELQESQEQLIQSEKLASLGGMVAGVAHEMNTPLAYVSSNVTSVISNMEDINTSLKNIQGLYNEISSPQRDNNKIAQLVKKTVVDYEQLETAEIYEESKELLEDGSHGLGEISNLVVSLKDFARLDRQTTESVAIESCLDNTLTIATNHIKENQVTVERNYGSTPEIECIPSKLNQLFLNIVTNAAQAIGIEGGTLKITTEQIGEKISIRFSDTGSGMDEETKQKMFDPFFTSKPIGEGTGLGMSIAYKIIEAHRGSIEVESELNVGTVITVTLPIKNEE